MCARSQIVAIMRVTNRLNGLSGNLRARRRFSNFHARERASMGIYVIIGESGGSYAPVTRTFFDAPRQMHLSAMEWFSLSLSSPPTSRGVCPSLFVGCFRAFFLPSPAPIVSARVRKTDRIFFRPDLLDSRGSGSCVKFLLAGRFFFALSVRE